MQGENPGPAEVPTLLGANLIQRRKSRQSSLFLAPTSFHLLCTCSGPGPCQGLCFKGEHSFMEHRQAEAEYCWS